MTMRMNQSLRSTRVCSALGLQIMGGWSVLLGIWWQAGYNYSYTFILYRGKLDHTQWGRKKKPLPEWKGNVSFMKVCVVYICLTREWRGLQIASIKMHLVMCQIFKVTVLSSSTHCFQTKEKVQSCSFAYNESEWWTWPVKLQKMTKSTLKVS